MIPERPATPLSSNLAAGASTSSSLLERARTNDCEAWARLVDWAGPLVYHWCCRAGVPASDREDVFQEVFLAVSTGLPGFRRDCPGDTFRGWLLTITRHKIIDLARRRLAQPHAAGGSEAYQRLLAVTDEVLSESVPTGPDAPQQRLRRAVEAIRGEFEAQTWRAFWRTAVDGLSAPEAARELGMTSAAVRKAKSRVLARLREEFGDLLE
jgi:RNA polymerase sigma-70 factor, ECF subfamily